MAVAAQAGLGQDVDQGAQLRSNQQGSGLFETGNRGRKECVSRASNQSRKCMMRSFNTNKMQYHDPSVRKCWDTNNLQKFETQKTGHKNVVLAYSQLRSKLQFKARDFFEKRCLFVEDETFYCYFSSSSSQDSEMPNPENIDRGETIFGIQKIGRREADGKIVIKQLMLCDYKLPLSNSVLKTFAPSGVKDWAFKLLEFVKNPSYVNSD